MKRSKILDSEFREFIDNELLKGTPYRDLSSELKTKGFQISASALLNYHRKHLSGTIEREDVEQFEEEATPILESFNADIDAIETLTIAYKRQAQIFSEKQSQYMKGGARFPSQDLKALKDLQILIKSHYSDYTTMNKGLNSASEVNAQAIRKAFIKMSDNVEHEKLKALFWKVDTNQEPIKNLKKAVEMYANDTLTDNSLYMPQILISPSNFNTTRYLSLDDIHSEYNDYHN